MISQLVHPQGMATTCGRDSTAPEERVVATVLSYNSRATLEDVIAAVRRQTRSVDAGIIVDNGSDDGTPSMLGHLPDPSWHVTLLGENVGVGAGHTIGWKAGMTALPEADFIWVLEHDTVPTPNCLERLLVATKATTADPVSKDRIVAVPAQQFPFRTTRSRTLKLRRRLLRLEGKAAGREVRQEGGGGRFTFNGVLLPVAMVREVGYPRSDFFVGLEDREFAARVRQAGGRIIRVEDARVSHVRPQHGSLSSPTRWYYSARNQVFMDRHLMNTRFARTLAVSRLLLAVGVILATVKGDRWRYIRARAQAVWDGERGRMGRREDLPFTSG